MKIKKKEDILSLLKDYKGVLVNWREHSSKYNSLYETVYRGINIKNKYKLFVRIENSRSFKCYSSDNIESLVGTYKPVKESEVFYIL